MTDPPLRRGQVVAGRDFGRCRREAVQLVSVKCYDITLQVRKAVLRRSVVTDLNDSNFFVIQHAAFEAGRPNQRVRNPHALQSGSEQGPRGQ